MSFPIITQSFIYGYLSFDFFACMNWIGCSRHLMRISCQQHLQKNKLGMCCFYFICCMFLIIFHLLLLAVIPFSCCLSMPLTHNYLYIIVSIFSFFSSVLLSDVIPLPALFFLLASVVSPEMIEGKTSQKKLACFKSRINIKL